MTVESFHKPCIEAVLLFAVGEISTNHVRELGAVEADSLSTVALGDGHVADQPNVGPQHDRCTIFSDGGKLGKFLKAMRFQSRFFFQTAVFLNDGRWRRRVKAARVGIEDHCFFRGDLLHDALDPDQGRNAEGLGHDHRVGVLFPRFGYDAENLLVV